MKGGGPSSIPSAQDVDDRAEPVGRHRSPAARRERAEVALDDRVVSVDEAVLVDIADDRAAGESKHVAGARGTLELGPAPRAGAIGVALEAGARVQGVVDGGDLHRCCGQEVRDVIGSDRDALYRLGRLWGADPRSRRGGVEPPALLVVLQRRGELVELALEELVEVVRRVLDAMV